MSKKTNLLKRLSYDRVARFELLGTVSAVILTASVGIIGGVAIYPFLAAWGSASVVIAVFIGVASFVDELLMFWHGVKETVVDVFVHGMQAVVHKDLLIKAMMQDPEVVNELLGKNHKFSSCPHENEKALIKILDEEYEKYKRNETKIKTLSDKFTSYTKATSKHVPLKSRMLQRTLVIAGIIGTCFTLLTFSYLATPLLAVVSASYLVYGAMLVFSLVSGFAFAMMRLHIIKEAVLENLPNKIWQSLKEFFIPEEPLKEMLFYEKLGHVAKCVKLMVGLLAVIGLSIVMTLAVGGAFADAASWTITRLAGTAAMAHPGAVNSLIAFSHLMIKAVFIPVEMFFTFATGWRTVKVLAEAPFGIINAIAHPRVTFEKLGRVNNALKSGDISKIDLLGASIALVIIAPVALAHFISEGALAAVGAGNPNGEFSSFFIRISSWMNGALSPAALGGFAAGLTEAFMHLTYDLLGDEGHDEELTHKISDGIVHGCHAVHEKATGENHDGHDHQEHIGSQIAKVWNKPRTDCKPFAIGGSVFFTADSSSDDENMEDATNGQKAIRSSMRTRAGKGTVLKDIVKIEEMPGVQSGR